MAISCTSTTESYYGYNIVTCTGALSSGTLTPESLSSLDNVNKIKSNIRHFKLQSITGVTTISGDFSSVFPILNGVWMPNTIVNFNPTLKSCDGCDKVDQLKSIIDFGYAGGGNRFTSITNRKVDLSNLIGIKQLGANLVSHTDIETICLPAGLEDFSPILPAKTIAITQGDLTGSINSKTVDLSNLEGIKKLGADLWFYPDIETMTLPASLEDFSPILRAKVDDSTLSITQGDHTGSISKTEILLSNFSFTTFGPNLIDFSALSKLYLYKTILVFNPTLSNCPLLDPTNFNYTLGLIQNLNTLDLSNVILPDNKFNYDLTSQSQLKTLNLSATTIEFSPKLPKLVDSDEINIFQGESKGSITKDMIYLVGEGVDFTFTTFGANLSNLGSLQSLSLSENATTFSPFLVPPSNDSGISNANTLNIYQGADQKNVGTITNTSINLSELTSVTCLNFNISQFTQPVISLPPLLEGFNPLGWPNFPTKAIIKNNTASNILNNPSDVSQAIMLKKVCFVLPQDPFYGNYYRGLECLN